MLYSPKLAHFRSCSPNVSDRMFIVFWMNSFKTSPGLVRFLYACQSATREGGLSAGLFFKPQPFPHDVLTTSQCFLCFINICMVSNRLLRA